MPQPLHVALGERSYPILFTDSVSEQISEFATAQIALCMDSELIHCGAPGCRDLLKSDFPIYHPQRHGECLKELNELGKIFSFLGKCRMSRGGTLVAVGGGVIGDLVGFAAASYLRGIYYIQVPTTLLAMVDSSVGGKTGINTEHGKNLVGAFWQPEAVLIHTDFLATLPPEEFSAGMAEVIKYGMLYDAELFNQLESLPACDDKTPELAHIIRRCCEIKADIVAGDERETASSGGRALLNLGHTFGHAIENSAEYGTYLHGEAVSIGLVLAARLSLKLSERNPHSFQFTQNYVERVEALLKKNHLPTHLSHSLVRNGESVPPPQLDAKTLTDAMHLDKKVRDGHLRFIAMEFLGSAVTVEDVPGEWLAELWQSVGAI